MSHARGYAAFDPASPLGPFDFDRRDPGPSDVRIDILFCGVCHSDLHTAKGEWGGVGYPCVPGHEIAGRVTAVGKDVKGFKAGDLAAIGCMVDSCRTCASCAAGLEQYCDVGKQVFTYNTPDPHRPGERTYGGYSNHIVADEAFCLRLPSSLDTAAAAPLLCAGVTTYSPLRHWEAGPGKKVGVVGLGGLGHMAVKFSHAFGAETVLFTTSPKKVPDGKRLGADEVVISSDDAAMKARVGTLDLIINTVAFSHNLDPFIALLKRDSSMVMLGAPQFPHPSPTIGQLIFRRRSLAGSLIGGIRETQEMLDYCGQKNIVCDIETIPMRKINEAYERMVKSDVKYRFVIDMSTL